MHNIRTKRLRPHARRNPRTWYAHKRKLRIDGEIRKILGVQKAAASCEGRASLPPVWTHKSEALTGDTIYLAHDNQIRSFILSAVTEAEAGRVSVASPIGSALLGKHQGDTVHLMTIDGYLDYTILKII